MNITFILKDGTKKIVAFEGGQTMLQVAEENGIKLNSNCEGFGVCGGCHVKIENLLDKLPEVSEKESDTLDRVSGVSMDSRLACQIVLNSNLNGLIVKLI
ncbi:MAG: 2Fe-2S iron-sulfur cluster binding domain-containing protein [Alphaproteobacteria bacterium]|nr:2Fe-2S iron-sulfur cluster binding domain-containing protein [Alphaproteobacteria bacterium]